MVWMLRDSRQPVELAPGKWPSAPLFGKGCCASEADGSGRGKSKLHVQRAVDVRGEVAQRWNSFRVADHSSITPSTTCFCILRPARSPMGKGRFLLASTRLHVLIAKEKRYFQKSNVCLLLRFHHAVA